MEASQRIDTNQATVGTSATLIADTMPGRKRVTIKNYDASVTMYVGRSSVTTSTGMEIKAGESMEIKSEDAVYGIVSAGSITAGALHER